MIFPESLNEDRRSFRTLMPCSCTTTRAFWAYWLSVAAVSSIDLARCRLGTLTISFRVKSRGVATLQRGLKQVITEAFLASDLSLLMSRFGS